MVRNCSYLLNVRAGEYGQVYTSLYTLARFFTEPNDKWLADHFYERCLSASNSVSENEGLRMAEAYCNMGRALEDAGLLLLNTVKEIYVYICQMTQNFKFCTKYISKSCLPYLRKPLNMKISLNKIGIALFYKSVHTYKHWVFLCVIRRYWRGIAAFRAVP